MGKKHFCFFQTDGCETLKVKVNELPFANLSLVLLQHNQIHQIHDTCTLVWSRRQQSMWWMYVYWLSLLRRSRFIFRFSSIPVPADWSPIALHENNVVTLHLLTGIVFVNDLKLETPFPNAMSRSRWQKIFLIIQNSDLPCVNYWINGAIETARVNKLYYQFNFCIYFGTCLKTLINIYGRRRASVIIDWPHSAKRV